MGKFAETEKEGVAGNRVTSPLFNDTICTVVENHAIRKVDNNKTITLNL